MDVARRAERPMRRRVDIRTIYDRIKVRYPDAYIAIQSGDFVSFILSQARELALPMGETLNRDFGYDSLSVHKLRFDDLARRIQLQTHRPVVHAERVDCRKGFMVVRWIKGGTPPNSDGE